MRRPHASPALPPILLALLVLLALPSTPAAAQSISFTQAPVLPGNEPPEVPIEGRRTRVTLPARADTVTIIWRPSSVLADTVVIPVHGQEFDWTPDRPGVASLTTNTGTSTRVSVQYASYPASGVFILIMAGTILFGGAGFALGKLLGGESPPKSAGRVDT